VKTRTWAPLGFARPADYARERLGLSSRELHDLAHVGAALSALPAIDAALTSGRLGWTKARLLCRVATPEDEARWLSGARRLSAAALAREVRAIERGALEASAPDPEDEEPEPRKVLRIRTRRDVLSRFGALKSMLRWVSGEWLPNEIVVELVAAEVLSAIRLDADPHEAPPLVRDVRAREHAPEPEAAPLPEVAAPTPSPFLDGLVAGLADATPRELDRRLCRAARLEQRRLARIGTLLFALAGARGHFDLGYRSLDAYARERLGISPRKARALLRVERACALAPAFRDAWHSGQISWCQAQALVPLVLADGSEPLHAAWLERAAGVTLRRLEDDVDHALAAGRFDPALLPERPALPDLSSHMDDAASSDPLALPAGVQISARPMGCGESMETAVWVAHVPADVARLFRACLCSVARRFDLRPGAALELMFQHCLESWRPSFERRPVRDYRVFERDGWRCTVPGCTSYRNLHAHHVTFRSRGGGDEDANLTTLCAAHHQRGVHGGAIRITGHAPDGLVFELPVGRFASGDRVAARYRFHHARGSGIRRRNSWITGRRSSQGEASARVGSTSLSAPAKPSGIWV
jgi:hypothetical protein